MRFAFLGSIAALCLASGLANAQGLKSLETGVDASPWEAVGRLDISGLGFCTGALIAENLVLTAAHCLYNKHTGERLDHTRMTFLAGWRNGRASAYRNVRRAVIHPEYDFSKDLSSARVRNDVALLELDRPIRNTTIKPFATAGRPGRGDHVGVVSYARKRAEAPSLQEVCTVLARQEGVIVTSCSVDLGASGAPIFSFAEGEAQIVSVVSAKAEMEGAEVSLGTSLTEPLRDLRAELAAGKGFHAINAAPIKRIGVDDQRRETGAKFVRPQVR